MSSSHRGSRAPIGRTQFILRIALVLAIALLSIPVLSAVAGADEGTSPADPAATTAAETAPDPAAADPAPADATAEETAPEPAPEAAPEQAAPEPAAPVKPKGTLASTNLTRTTAAATTTATTTTSSGCAASFDQSTQQVHATGHDYAGVPASKWINGNLNNDGYAEGDYVPQRVRLTGLTAGSTQTLTFRYDRQVSGKYAFDFVADLRMTGGTATWDAAPGNPPMAPAGAVFVTVTFTPTSSAATLYWEGHIASELDYLDQGLNLGAGSISGSNYHFFLESLSCGNVGGQTNQMKSSQVAAGQVTVIKDAQPDSAQDFGFLIQAPNAANDTVLDDDNDPTRSNETHSRVAPGTTTVTETQAPGWTLASIACTQTSIGQSGGTAITPLSVDLAAGKVSVAIADDKNVTCTFVNTRLAKVTVDKVWRVNGVSYAEGAAQAAFPQLGLTSSLTLTGPAPAGASTQAWGTSRGGYLEGSQTTIDETSHATNNLCSTVTGKVTSANGTDVQLALPYSPTLQGGDNRYTITNTIDCRANLTLVKVVDNGPAVATGWTLSAAPTERPALDGPSGATGSSDASGHISAGTAYALSETGGDSRYVQQGPWTCTDTGAVTTVDGKQRVTVEPGRSATCTVHNATAKVTLVKSVTNDDGGSATADQWTLHAGGSSGTSGQSFWVRPGDTLALSESGGPSGYGAGPSSLTCSDAPGTQVTSVTPTAGSAVTCTFVNDDEPAGLALTKLVAQGDSGAGTPATDFTLTATPQGIAGQSAESGAGGFPTRAVSAGTYLLSESGPAGYTPGTWTCSGGTMGGSAGAQTVTVANAGSASCTITNTAIMPTLTLVKEVERGSTGTTTPATAWTLTANGPTMVTGSTGSTGPSGVTARPVPVGTYALSEAGPTAGWTASAWTCTGGAGLGGTTAAPTVAIGLGQNVVCTITNTATPAHLSLDKDARANGTGTGVGDRAWTLAYAGPVTAAGPGGVARDEVPIGNYTLTESGPTAGWTASAWTCTRALSGGGTTAHQVTTDADGTGHVNLALGEDVGCQVVNTAQPAHLSLDKDAQANGTGTTLGDDDWTLAFDGPDSGSGAGGVARTRVAIGSYTLTETGPTAGWTASAWSCGTHPVTTDADGTGHLTLALAEDVACTITNTATKPGLTLLKKVDGNGTGAETSTPDTAWTLHADLVGNESPAVAVAGPEGSASVTGARLPAGTYALSESGGPAPWTQVGWVCTDTTGAAVPVTHDTVTIALGQDVACEVTNRAVPSTWTVTKSNTPGSGATVNEGDVITYTVTATKNPGGVDVLGATVTDDLSGILPTKGALVAGSITTSSGTADPVGTSIVWTIPRLGGTAQTLTYQVVVGSLDGVTLRNHATGDGAEECLDGDPACTTTNPTPHYLLRKSVDFVDADGDGKAEPGQQLTYTLHLRNDSQADLTDVVVHDDISDVLEHGTLDESALAAQGITLDDSDPAQPFLVWKVAGPVPPTGTAEATYTVTVADGAWGEQLVNVATPEDGVGSCKGADDCTTTTDTPPATTLTLRKDVDPGRTGDDTAATAWHLSATPSPAIAGQGVVEGDGSVTETVRIGTFRLAEDGPDTYRADDAGWVCTDRNGDRVPVTGDEVTTPRGAHVTCAITNHAVPSGWRVTKTSPTNLGTVRPGDTIEYQLTAERVGTGVDVRDIDVTDHLVDVLGGGRATFDTGSPVASTGGSVTEPSGGGTDLVWHIDRLHDTATLDYSVTVGDVHGAVLRNVAAPGSEPCVDPDPEDAVDCDSTTHYTPHYVLDKDVDFADPDGDQLANPGQDLTYTHTVRNDTHHAVMDGAVVIDDLSDVLLDAAMTSTTDELAAQGLALTGPAGDQRLEWTVPGPIAPGASVSASYVVTIDAHAWGRTLRNVATPQDDAGDCAGLPVLSRTTSTGGGGACTTSTDTPQVTTLVVKKVDMDDDAETPAGLPGAEFALYRDLGTVGSLDDADVLVPPLDDPDGDGDTVTGADGLARWGELRPGRYLVVEVSAPPGYDLPDPDSMPVVISDPGNFVPGGEMATLLFRDIAQGQLTVTKQQWEKSGDGWVASDGVVAHGDLVKYTLHVETQGLKRFHDVTVRDYVPDGNPLDTTSTGTASLVAGSAACVQVACTVDVVDGLITWRLGTLRDAAVDVEFVVRFPDLPAHPTYDEDAEFRTVLWNQAYVDWRQVTGHGEGGPVFAPGSAASNEVEVEAVVTQPEQPVEPPIIPEEPATPPGTPPGHPVLPVLPVLPGTGAPEHLLRLAFLGSLAVALGIALAGRRRRRGGVG